MKHAGMWGLYLLVATATFVTADDYWAPRGAPGSDAARMRTLDEIEPRTPIASLPFVIDEPGAYFLASDVQGVSGSNGIIVNCSSVLLDLHGFSLVGTNGSLDGIAVPCEIDGLIVRGGVIYDWGGNGIGASNASMSSFSDVTLYTNGLCGLVAGFNSRIERCGTYLNGFNSTNHNHGFLLSDYCTVVDCKAMVNNGHGFIADEAAKFKGCTSVYNGNDGFHVYDFSYIRDCSATYNVKNGITVWTGCRVVDNMCAENGWLTGWFGIRVMGDDNRVSNNSLLWNGAGVVIDDYAEGNLVVHNSAANNSTYGDYLWSSNNFVGQLLDGNDMISTEEGFFGGGPWSNFTY